MGCLKLRYGPGGGLEKSVIFLGGTLSKKKAPLKKRDNYYPFGLQTADSWVADQTEVNNYLYNAASELNETTNNYQTFFRDYDPALGRMTGVDIMANKYSSISPYNYAFNDPIGLNDPSGADPFGGGANPGGWSFENGDWYDNRPPMEFVDNRGSNGNNVAFFGSLYLGSGGNWADGMGNLDWTLAGGSNTFRAERAYARGNGGTYNDASGTYSNSEGNRIDASSGYIRFWNSNGGDTNVDLGRWLANGGNINDVLAAVAAGNGFSLTLGAWEYFSQDGGRVNLSGSADDVFNGLIAQFDHIFEGPFLRQPNDGRGKNQYNIKDLVSNPPKNSGTGAFTKVLSSPDLYTKSGVRFRWAISPADYDKAENYTLGYLYDIETDAGLSIGAMHLLGRDGHSVLTLTIYGRENFVPIFNKVYKGYRHFD